MNQKAKVHLDKLLDAAAEEIAKVTTDRIVYGIGMYRLYEDGTVEHIPYGTEIPEDEQ